MLRANGMNDLHELAKVVADRRFTPRRDMHDTSTWLIPLLILLTLLIATCVWRMA